MRDKTHKKLSRRKGPTKNKTKKVINAFPERRKLVVSGTDRRSTTSITVVVHDIEKRLDKEVLLSTPSMRPTVLDLSRVASLQLLRSLFVWEEVHAESALRLSNLALRKIAALQTLLPPAALQFAVDPGTEMMTPLPAEATHLGNSLEVANQLVEELAFVEDNNFMELEKFTNMDLRTLYRLVSEGVVELHHDEFGIPSVAISLEHIAYTPGIRARAPHNVLLKCASMPGAGSLPKLALAVQLDLAGWRAMPMPLRPAVAGGAKQCRDDCLARSRWYMVALLWSDAVWKAGAPSIRHNMPEAYYQALLTVPDLKRLAQLDNLDRVRNACWKRCAAAKSLDPAFQECAGADNVLEDMDDNDDDANGDEERPASAIGMEVATDTHAPKAGIELLALGASDANAALMQPITISHAGEETLVRFDGFSHTSGMQRAYTRCKNDKHTACFKYMTVGSRPKTWAACYLHLWRVAGHSLPTKAAHRDTVFPTDDEVDRLHDSL